MLRWDCWGSHTTSIPGHHQQHLCATPPHSPARPRDTVSTSLSHPRPAASRRWARDTSATKRTMNGLYKTFSSYTRTVEALRLPGEEQPCQAMQPGPEIAQLGFLLLFFGVSPEGHGATRGHLRFWAFPCSEVHAPPCLNSERYP